MSQSALFSLSELQVWLLPVSPCPRWVAERDECMTLEKVPPPARRLITSLPIPGKPVVQPPTARETQPRAPRIRGVSSAPESSSSGARSLPYDSMLFPHDLAQLSRGFSYLPQEATIASDSWLVPSDTPGLCACGGPGLAVGAARVHFRGMDRGLVGDIPSWTCRQKGFPAQVTEANPSRRPSKAQDRCP